MLRLASANCWTRSSDLADRTSTSWRVTEEVVSRARESERRKQARGTHSEELDRGDDFIAEDMPEENGVKGHVDDTAVEQGLGDKLAEDAEELDARRADKDLIILGGRRREEALRPVDVLARAG